MYFCFILAKPAKERKPRWFITGVTTDLSGILTKENCAEFVTFIRTFFVFYAWEARLTKSVQTEYSKI